VALIGVAHGGGRTQRDPRQRLVGRSVGRRAVRRLAADVDGLLMAIGRWWRRRATLMRAPVRSTRHSRPNDDIDVVGG
jgi:hypothetical protein